MSRFHENLRALRESHGVTQEKLGQQIGVAKSTISMYESGSREPSFEIMESIADCLNVSLANLVGDPGTPSGLAPDEAKLLSDYRSLSGEGKLYLRQTARLATQVDPEHWIKQ